MSDPLVIAKSGTGEIRLLPTMANRHGHQVVRGVLGGIPDGSGRR
ncbi:MAG TPA: hypothetical protein VNX27_01275 [Chthoniobacterales bacterium]|nr:hypothetical protein [Chthoniobacterales bacterium]